MAGFEAIKREIVQLFGSDGFCFTSEHGGPYSGRSSVLQTGQAVALGADPLDVSGRNVELFSMC